MKKNRTNLAAACLATALVLASCSTEELTNMTTEPDNHGGGLQTITASTGTGGADTRLVYEEDSRVGMDGTKGITVKWNTNDVIQLILKDATTATTSNYKYTGTASVASASFNLSSGTALRDGAFYAFFGMYSILHDNGINYRMFSTDKATQIASDPMSHLSSDNAMMASGTCTDGNTESITFESLMAMVSLNITLPDGEKPSKVWIYSPSKKLVHDRICKAATKEAIEFGEYETNALSLSISGENTNSFNAHYLLVPTNLSAEDLYVIVQCSGDKYYCSSVFTGANFEAGMRYAKKIEVKAAAVTSGKGASDDPWIISDAATLRTFSLASQVAQSNMKNKYVKLEQNINLEGGEEFVPIGGGDNITIHFDGNDKTISGLIINKTSGYAGLIGFLQDGSIKNLTVSGEVSGRTAGGMVGNMNGATLEGRLTSKVTVNGKLYAGGIAGEASVTLADGLSLSNEAPVTANQTGLGNAYAGGLFGNLSVASWGENTTTFSNSGRVEATSLGNNYDSYAGGFIGRLGSTTTPSYTTGTCSGAVTATANSNKFAAWAGWKVGCHNDSNLETCKANTVAANTGYDAADPKPDVTATNSGGKAYVNGAEPSAAP